MVSPTWRRSRRRWSAVIGSMRAGTPRRCAPPTTLSSWIPLRWMSKLFWPGCTIWLLSVVWSSPQFGTHCDAGGAARYVVVVAGFHALDRDLVLLRRLPAADVACGTDPSEWPGGGSGQPRRDGRWPAAVRVAGPAHHISDQTRDVSGPVRLDTAAPRPAAGTPR